MNDREPVALWASFVLIFIVAEVVIWKVDTHEARQKPTCTCSHEEPQRTKGAE